jgi:hypothetical protein
VLRPAIKAFLSFIKTVMHVIDLPHALSDARSSEATSGWQVMPRINESLTRCRL